MSGIIEANWKMDKVWRVLHLSDVTEALNLNLTLFCGQTFVWSYIDGLYAGVLNRHVVMLKPSLDGLEYCFTPDTDEGQEILRRYFQLDVDLKGLYTEWALADQHFREVSSAIKGLRLVRQDPFECTISFICSQNNNISRITQNVESIRSTYGSHIIEMSGKDWHSFPTVEQLSLATEDELKRLGLGYRAKYMVTAVQQIQDKGGEEWLNSLYGESHEVLRTELTSLMGIGSKVADCISLFAMGRHDCIPVDTHVWQIAQAHYLPSLRKQKAPTKSSYEQVRIAFQQLFGEYAGWAHSVLFAGDLSSIGPPLTKRKGVPLENSKKRPKLS